MKFAFIHVEKASFPIAPMCRLLGVTRQGYYAYASRPAPEKRASELTLRAQVTRIHRESGTYGSPRTLRELRASGFRRAEDASSVQCEHWAFKVANEVVFGRRRRRTQLIPLLQTFSTVSLPRVARTNAGSRTSRTFGPTRAGAIWPLSSTYFRGESWAGPWKRL